MNSGILRTILFLLFPLLGFSTDTIVGYYPFWVQDEFSEQDLHLDHLTHVMHAFAYPRPNGTIDMHPNFLNPQLNARVHEAGKSILLSLGGWGNSEGFPPMAADSTTRRLFIENVINFCQQHNYDGVDLDWEYPKSAQERHHLSLLIREMRQAFDQLDRSQPLLITMAVTASDWNGKWWDYDALTPHVDWFGCMTYDFHGPWTNHAGHNSPLYPSGGDTDGSVSQGIAYLTQTRNVPPDKVLLGIPFYGRGFNASELYGSATGSGGEYHYSDIPGLLESGWTRYWDDVAKVPYLTNSQNTMLISYDDTLSVRHKAEYAISKQLKGVMIWALGQDHSDGQQPLLGSISRAMAQQTRVGRRQETPSKVVLNSYPNPFNQNTRISVSLPSASQITLDVYDLCGRRVSRVFQGPHAGGSRSFAFVAPSVASGVYLCTLSTDDNLYSTQLTLLR